jgi:hypothetical protein
MATRATSTESRSGKLSFRPWAMLGTLGVLLLILFGKSLDPHQILFANDYPLGALVADCNHLPNRFTGTWREIAWLGGEAPAASPNITMLLLTLLSPVAYLKTYAPFTLLFLGFSAWLFFRQLNFHPVVCLLGGVAAGLNSHFFSISCWGLGNWSIVAGCAFLAMAALYAKSIPKVWERAVLAGLATGMVVMEGYDVGAIVSVYIGVFIAFHALNNEGPLSKRTFNAFITEALVILFAGFIAYHTMKTLVRTQVEGVASMEQDADTKKTRWNAATQWSLPKVETLQILVPGLFGYRLSGNIDQKDHSGAYWGLIGQDPRIAGLASDDPNERSNVVVSGLKLSEGYLTNLDTPNRFSRTVGMQAVTKKSGIYWRYSGSGECAGMMVSLLAIFALANFFGKDRPLSKTERIAIGFWGGVAVFSLLAAWGRYGFMYQFLYMIPEVSTIRNPIKFLHPFHIAWIILAAYGMEILYRRYLRNPEKNSSGFFVSQIKDWWAKVAGFDRKWTIFMMIFVGVAALGTVILFVEQSALIRYLQEQSFAAPLPKQIAAFCLQRAGAFVVILAAGVVVMAAILSGAWSGSSSKWAWSALAALIILDLARADIPWVHYYDYKEKYELNSVTEFLIDKPWEHRVIGKLEPRGPGSGIQQGFGQLYFFWLQNDFPFHNIQTLDFAQAAHMPDLDRLYLKAFELSGEAIRNTDLRPAVRLWELTNTRYIVGTASSAEDLNRRFDPVHRRFKVLSHFNFPRLKPGLSSAGDVGDMTIEPSEKGAYGIIEDTRALPRAKLYANWRTTTNDDETLKILSDQKFEPWDTLLVDANTPPPQPSSASTSDPGTVTITDYHPKNVRLKADVKTQSVLLLNDRYDTDWHVLLDGAPVAMLRCNDIMRGVSLPPGQHEVEFVFKPSLKTLYISVSAIVIGIILAGYLVITRKPVVAAIVKADTPTPPPATPTPPLVTKPAAPQAKKQKANGKAKK